MLVECFDCSAKVKAIPRGEYFVTNPSEPTDVQKYSLLECPSCHQPILIHQDSYPDLIGNKLNLIYSTANQLYPQSEFYINPNIPEKLKNALIQCIICYQNAAFTASAVMCRRTIEGFCKENGANDNNLFKSIQKLKSSNIINDDLCEWADQLRISGNEAAHDIDIDFVAGDSKDILDFTLAILEFKYGYQARFESFKRRKNSK